ncbi:putative non-specific serine/threonine protein kinase [Helianthus annuus]|nr:putative non-specific serine/threonine protein kinase [Helianthus annuus]
MNTKQPIVFLSPSSPVHFLFYVLVIFLTPTTISFGYGGRNETDHHALLKIKSMITQDPYGALTSWNNSFHFCDWTGVTCGKRHKRVTRLALDSQGLEGSLSPHVGNLSFLRELSLSITTAFKVPFLMNSAIYPGYVSFIFNITSLMGPYHLIYQDALTLKCFIFPITS